MWCVVGRIRASRDKRYGGEELEAVFAAPPSLRGLLFSFFSFLGALVRHRFLGAYWQAVLLVSAHVLRQREFTRQRTLLPRYRGRGAPSHDSQNCSSPSLVLIALGQTKIDLHNSRATIANTQPVSCQRTSKMTWLRSFAAASCFAALAGEYLSRRVLSSKVGLWLLLGLPSRRNPNRQLAFCPPSYTPSSPPPVARGREFARCASSTPFFSRLFECHRLSTPPLNLPTPHTSITPQPSARYRGSSQSSPTFVCTLSLCHFPAAQSIPELSQISSVPTLYIEDGAFQITIDGIKGDDTPLKVSAASDNALVTGTPRVLYTSPASTAVLSFTPVEEGRATITVVVLDNDLDLATRTVSVNVLHKPVNCGYSDYTTFTSCTKRCNSGTQTRTRTITKRDAWGGAACDDTSLTGDRCVQHRRLLRKPA